MSNLLAGFGAVQSVLDRTKHRTATQLAAAESSPGTSKFESDLPGWQDSNFDVMQADRSVRRSQYGREGDCDHESPVVARGLVSRITYFEGLVIGLIDGLPDLYFPHTVEGTGSGTGNSIYSTDVSGLS